MEDDPPQNEKWKTTSKNKKIKNEDDIKKNFFTFLVN